MAATGVATATWTLANSTAYYATGFAPANTPTTVGGIAFSSPGSVSQTCAGAAAAGIGPAGVLDMSYFQSGKTASGLGTRITAPLSAAVTTVPTVAAPTIGSGITATTFTAAAEGQIKSQAAAPGATTTDVWTITNYNVVTNAQVGI